jgi:signal transduction histidine kinase
MNSFDPKNSQWNEKLDELKARPPEFFLAALLHELRNPLMLIKGYMEILSDDSAREHHALALETISKNIERLEQRFDDISDYILELRKKS